jgi:hypothetical protein
MILVSCWCIGRQVQIYSCGTTIYKILGKLYVIFVQTIKM